MSTKFIFFQPSLYQASLARVIKLTGQAGFFEQVASIELHPAEPNTGIVFCWNGNRFPASIDYLLANSRYRTTALSPEPQSSSESGNAIYTVEHLLSALYGLGISNCEIYVSQNGMIPFFDGSGHEFCSKILEAGKRVQEKYYRRAVYCQRRIRVQKNDTFIQIDPPTTGSLKVEAYITFPKPIGEQVLYYNHSDLSYCLNIAWARTFSARDFESQESIKEHLPAFKLEEQYEGSYIDSPMLVFQDSKYITTLRRQDEAVRHKVLDLLGDISLLGYELYGDIKVYKPGHRINWELVKTIYEHLIKESDELKAFTGGELQPKHMGDKSSFVRDVTVEDGSCFSACEQFEKIWEIQNTGEVPWVGRALIREGPSQGFGIIRSEPVTPIQTVAPGEIARLSIQLEAPTMPGSYRAEWKMVDPEGENVFPNQYPLFVVIRVT